MLTVLSWTVLQKVCIIRHLSFGSSGSSNNNAIIHPFVLLMACFNLNMQMKPILAGVNRTTLHECFQDLWWSCSSAFGPAITSVILPLSLSLFTTALVLRGGLLYIKKCAIVTFNHVVGIDVRSLVILYQPIRLIRQHPLVIPKPCNSESSQYLHEISSTRHYFAIKMRPTHRT